MKIERQEKEFTPIVLTIETREELEHLFAAVRSISGGDYAEVENAVPQIGGEYNVTTVTNIDKALFDCL